MIPRHKVLNFEIIFIALFFSFFSGYLFGRLYEFLDPGSLDTSIIGTADFWGPIVGFPLALIFFFPLLFAAFGTGNWRKWMWWALALPVAFEVIFDFSHLFLPIALGLGGYWLGILVRKISNKN